MLPFAFTLTNLDAQRAEIFYRAPVAPTAEIKATAARRYRSILGRSVALREVEDAHLVAALAGSSAIPILLDPVTIDFADESRTYIDGGVADSAPLDVARAFARRVQLIFVDPATAAVKPYLERGPRWATAAFSIAQNRVLEASLRSAYFATRLKRLFAAEALTPEQRALFEDSFDLELAVMRPHAELPVEVAGFDDDAAGIAQTYELGRQAGLRGFRDYDSGEAFG